MSWIKNKCFVGNLEPVPNKLNTKFLVSEDLSAFLCSQEKCMLILEMYRPLAVTHPQQSLKSSLYCLLCLKPAVSPHEE